jgi:hypothetical protein
VKYYIDFQHLPATAERPIDNGENVPFEVNDEKGPAVIPAVGDYVEVQFPGRNGMNFSGKVRSRPFRYFSGTDIESTCAVNIVVEDSNDDWGKLIKE